MKIVVLAGGLSTERDVSFKTAEMVAGALRENGHQVIVLDVFMGYSDKEEDLTDIFERGEEVSVRQREFPDSPGPCADQSTAEGSVGLLLWTECSGIVPDGRPRVYGTSRSKRRGRKVQATFDLFGIRYTGSGYMGSALRWIREGQSSFFQ